MSATDGLETNFDWERGWVLHTFESCSSTLADVNSTDIFIAMFIFDPIPHVRIQTDPILRGSFLQASPHLRICSPVVEPRYPQHIWNLNLRSLPLDVEGHHRWSPVTSRGLASRYCTLEEFLSHPAIPVLSPLFFRSLESSSGLLTTPLNKHSKTHCLSVPSHPIQLRLHLTSPAFRGRLPSRMPYSLSPRPLSSPKGSRAASVAFALVSGIRNHLAGYVMYISFMLSVDMLSEGRRKTS